MVVFQVAAHRFIQQRTAPRMALRLLKYSSVDLLES